MVASGVLPVHLMRPRFSATRAISPARRGWRPCGASVRRRACELGGRAHGCSHWRRPAAAAHCSPVAHPCAHSGAAPTCRHQPLLPAQHLHRRHLEDAAAALAAPPPAARAARPRPRRELALLVAAHGAGARAAHGAAAAALGAVAARGAGGGAVEGGAGRRNLAAEVACWDSMLTRTRKHARKPAGLPICKH